MRLGEGVVEGPHRIVEIGHSEHGGRRDERGAEHVLPQQRPGRQRAAGEWDGLGGRPAHTRVVVCEQREQQLLAEGRVPGPVSHVLESLGRPLMGLDYEEPVRDQGGLDQALDLGVGAPEIGQRPDEDGVRFLAAEEVELSAE